MEDASELHGDVSGIVGAEIIGLFKFGSGSDIDGKIFRHVKKGRNGCLKDSFD